MRMRRLGLVALLLSLVACTTSSLSPSDEVHLVGTVTDDSARPLGDRTVFVRKLLSENELEGRLQSALSSVQLACVVDRAPGACRRAHYSHTAETGDDGRYDVELKGQDTQTTLGLQASPLQVAVSGPRGPYVAGPASSLATYVQVKRLSLPPLRLWTSAPTVAATSGGGRVGWSPLPLALAGSPAYRVLVDDGAAGLVWDSGPLAGKTAYDLDARLLEDIDGALSVVATSNTRTTGSGVDLAFRSPRVHVKGVAGVPLSRGRPCTVGSGFETTLSASPCPFTDGDFDKAGRQTQLREALAARCPTPEDTVACGAARAWLQVDLEATISPTLVVLRGCPASCLVETSPDGGTWAVLGTASGPDATLQPRVPARWVRVTADGNQLAQITELSVWPARPGQRLAAPGTGLSVSPGLPADRSAPDRTVPLAVAAVLALLAVGGVGFALGRRW